MTSVRLPSDSGRAKGFGYAEFEDRQALLDALAFSEAVSLRILLPLQCVNCFATSSVHSLRSCVTSKLISFATLSWRRFDLMKLMHDPVLAGWL